MRMPICATNVIVIFAEIALFDTAKAAIAAEKLIT